MLIVEQAAVLQWCQDMKIPEDTWTWRKMTFRMILHARGKKL